MVGTAILGQVFDQLGWPACIAGIALSLGLAALLTQRLKVPADRVRPDTVVSKS